MLRHFTTTFYFHWLELILARFMPFVLNFTYIPQIDTMNLNFSRESVILERVSFAKSLRIDLCYFHILLVFGEKLSVLQKGIRNISY